MIALVRKLVHLVSHIPYYWLKTMRSMVALIRELGPLVPPLLSLHPHPCVEWESRRHMISLVSLKMG